MNEPGVTEADIHDLRQQNDLKAFMRDVGRDAAARCTARRALIARHPDLTARLHDIPGCKAWTGYLAPEIWNGATNTSPVRAALIELLTEAEHRDRTARPAPGPGTGSPMTHTTRSTP